jgi:hypothetical protein
VLLVCIVFSSFAQSERDRSNRPTFNKVRVGEESIDSTIVKIYNKKLEWIGDSTIRIIDTMHYRTHKLNYLERDHKLYAHMGLPGHANFNQIFTFNQGPQYNYGLSAFDAYISKPHTTNFYSSPVAFSMLNYVQAPDNGKILEGVLSTNVGNRLTFGFDFNFIYYPTSSNTYSRLDNFSSVHSLTNAMFDYKTRDKRYHVTFIHNGHKIENKENGGISDFDTFLSQQASNYSDYSTKLTNANNEIRDAGYYIDHSWELTPLKIIYDSIDSTKYTEHRKKFNLGRVGHTFNYHRNIFMYSEDNFSHDNYENIFIDSVNTYDSIRSSKVSNTIYWANSDIHKSKKSLAYYYGLTMENAWLHYADTNISFSQINLKAKMSKYLFGGIVIGGQLDYTQGGYNNFDTRIKGVIIKHIERDSLQNNRLEGGITYSLVEAPYFYHYYSSNNFKWHTDLDKQKVFAINGAFKSKRFNAGIHYYQIADLVYLSEELTPKQSGAMSVITSYAHTNLDLWKFNFDLYGAYQLISNKDIIALPDMLGTATLTYHDYFYKGALDFIIGAEARYNSAYKANAYMPALRSFYQQSGTSVGDYIWLDAFISMKVQKAILVLKLSHLNQGMMGYNYTHIPGYPTQPMEFTFSVKWRFFR